MRFAYGRVASLLACAVSLAACQPPGAELGVPARVAQNRSLANDVFIPASNGLGRAHQAITAGDGPNAEQVLFINFGGVTITKVTNDGDPLHDDATTNKSWIPNVGGSTVTIPAFDATPFIYAPQTAQTVRDVITQQVKDWYAPYNIYVVTTRPASGRYSMMVVGGITTQVVTGQQDAVGVAGLDCGNDNQNNIGFAFSGSLPPQTTSPQDKQIAQLLIAQTIAHEGGHTFGLDHVNSPMATAVDIMEPAVDPNVAGFLTGNQPLSDGSSMCGAGATEDTHGRLLNNLGPAPTGGSTVAKPTVQWLAPKNGAAVPRQFTAAVSVTAGGGTITKVEIIQGGVIDATINNPPYQVGFTVPASVPDGAPVRFTAIAYNSLGGKASVATDFTIQGSATQAPIGCILKTDCMTNESCTNSKCVAVAPTCMPACKANETCQDDGTCLANTGDMAGTTGTTPTTVGMACTDSAECGTDGLCATANGKQYCTQACVTTDPNACPSDYECVAVGADHYCGPKSHGCEMSGRSSGSSSLPVAFMLFALVALVLRKKALPSAT